MDVLLHCQDSLVLIRKFEFLRKFRHDQMFVIIIIECEELELKVNLIVRVLLNLHFILFLLLRACLQSSFLKTLLVQLLEELGLELVISFLEVRDKPVHNVL